MKKSILIALLIVWGINFIILIVALTNIMPNNSFQNYKLIIGISFFVITSIVLRAIKKHSKTK